MKKHFLALLLSVLTLGSVSACNTVEGMGADIEKAGDGIEDTARENKKY